MHIDEAPKYIRKLPYVTELFWLETRRYCEGWYKQYPGQKPRKCKRAAQWRFSKSKSKGPGRHPTAYVCTYHLIKNCLEYSKYETKRVDRALKKAGMI